MQETEYGSQNAEVRIRGSKLGSELAAEADRLAGCL